MGHMSATTPSALLQHARILSPVSRDATSLAVEGDTVTWVGQDAPGPTLFPDAAVVDCAQAWIAPPFLAPGPADTGVAASCGVLVAPASAPLDVADPDVIQRMRDHHHGGLRLATGTAADPVGRFLEVLEQAATELGGPHLAGLTPSLQGLDSASLAGLDEARLEALSRFGAALVLEPLRPGSLDGVDVIRIASAGVTIAAEIARDGELLPWQAVAALAGAGENPAGAARALSPRAAFTAATRGAARVLLGQRSPLGVLQPGAPASLAAWETGELVTRAADDAVQRWSTDPRSGVPPMPDLEGPTPRCRALLADGTLRHDEDLFGAALPAEATR